MTNKQKKAILDQIRAFTDAEEPRLILILSKSWDKQQNAIKYSDLVRMIQTGEIDTEVLTTWTRMYSKLVADYFADKYRDGIKAGAKNAQSIYGYKIDFSQNGIEDWIEDHGAQLVVSLVVSQRDALKAILKHAYDTEQTVDDLSRVIRPTIGLYPQQSTAVARYYNTLLNNGRKKKDAQKLAANYAARLHRYRAMMIARTEMAFAYNHGNDESIRQAQSEGLIGDVVKIWSTADDERVCSRCGPMDGKEVGMNDYFVDSSGHRVLKPPLHPHCRCGIIYQQV